MIRKLLKLQLNKGTMIKRKFSEHNNYECLLNNNFQTFNAFVFVTTSSTVDWITAYAWSRA